MRRHGLPSGDAGACRRCKPDGQGDLRGVHGAVDPVGGYCMPYRVLMEQVRKNLALAHVKRQLIERGVHCEFTSVEQHHDHLGRCERTSGVWKEICRRVRFDQQLISEGDVEAGAAERSRAKNSMMRRGGCAPVQGVLGAMLRASYATYSTCTRAVPDYF